MSLTEIKYEMAQDKVNYIVKTKKNCYVANKYEADFVIKVAAEMGVNLKSKPTSNGGSGLMLYKVKKGDK